MQQYGRETQFVCLFLVSIVYACSGEKSSPQKVAQVSSTDMSQSAAAGCDASLWNHVYNPTRLQQLATCVSVTGTIDESNVDEDGDQHFLLKLDPGQDTLVNKRNYKKKSGDIVLEIVCANPTTMKKARSACAGYASSRGTWCPSSPSISSGQPRGSPVSAPGVRSG